MSWAYSPLLPGGTQQQSNSTQTLIPSLFTDADTFYSPTVHATYALTPSLFTDADTFYSPSVAFQISPSLFTDADTFFSPTVTPGAVTLTPSLFTDGDTFYSATVRATYTLTPSLFTDGDTFYSPTVRATNTLTPSLFSDADTFYAPTVHATYALTPSLFTNSQTFYSPTVSLAGSPQTLSPSLFTNSQIFYSPTVTGGAVARQQDGDADYWNLKGWREKRKTFQLPKREKLFVAAEAAAERAIERARQLARKQKVATPKTVEAEQFTDEAPQLFGEALLAASEASRVEWKRIEEITAALNAAANAQRLDAVMSAMRKAELLALGLRAYKHKLYLEQLQDDDDAILLLMG